MNDILLSCDSVHEICLHTQETETGGFWAEGLCCNRDPFLKPQKNKNSNQQSFYKS